MLKKAVSFVLAGHSRLTIAAPFTGVPCLIWHGMTLRGSTYGLRKRLFRQAMGGPGRDSLRFASKTLGAHQPSCRLP